MKAKLKIVEEKKIARSAQQKQHKHTHTHSRFFYSRTNYFERLHRVDVAGLHILFRFVLLSMCFFRVTPFALYYDS